MRERLKYRETWGYLAGIGLAMFSFIATHLGLDAGMNGFEYGAWAGPIIAALMGPSAYAQVKRGQQRGEQIIAAAQPAVQQVRSAIQDIPEAQVAPPAAVSAAPSVNVTRTAVTETDTPNPPRVVSEQAGDS